MRSGVGVETCSFLSAEGNAFGGVAWKRVSLYPRRAIRSVEWRRNVFPCIRGGQCARCRSVETCFLVSAEGNVLGGVAWKRGPLYPRRAMRSGVAWKRGTLYPQRSKLSVEWRGNMVPCSHGAHCARWGGVETWYFVSREGNALGGVAWKRGSFYPRRAMFSVEWRGKVVPSIRGGQCAQ